MSARRGMGSAGATLRRPAVDARRADGDPSLVSALAGSPSEAGQALRMVQVAEVAEHPNNPRDELGDLTELAASIKTLGMRQPILVVPVSTFRAASAVDLPAHARWVVLAGHRRRAACELAGVSEMPAWVRTDLTAEADAAETFLAENVHRRGLAPLEEARAMALLVDLGFSQRQIAERGGFAQSHVSRRLALLRLPQQVQDALASAEITVGDALAIRAEVEAARQAGTFVAGADSMGTFAYFSTAPRSNPGNDEESERRAASTARAAAAAQLVARKAAGREATEDLVDAVLRDRVPYSESLRLVHEWLGDSVGITGTDMCGWRDSIAELDAASRLWVAWAMTVAGVEARMRLRGRRWDVEDRAYLERLAEGVGYVPSEWEKQRLARIDVVRDSDGITGGEEA